ncbi:UNVERIFIED_CONTAM: hypothetical protein FKN15_056688 [Acipenser sinensis]
MLLSGAGDALGYRNQLWEYNQSGPCIHRELQEMGGLMNIVVQLPDWPVSDDTVLHLATAEALATGKEGEELLLHTSTDVIIPDVILWTGLVCSMTSWQRRAVLRQ